MEDFLSVGIDIGTLTTQLVFSKITIENTASVVSLPMIKIVSKNVIYNSDIHFTPLASPTEIDTSKLREIIINEYQKANIKAKDIRTGAVIITGETAKKENAREVLKILSDLAGDFVVVTAGPELEGIIAGKGAGASNVSRERAAVVANLDIGGGTTNIAVFKNGEVIDTACLAIGGRHIEFEEKTLTVKNASKKIKELAKKLGIHLNEGEELSYGQIKTITDRLAKVLEEVMGLNERTTFLDLLVIDHDLKRNYSIDFISFSGGVADGIYKNMDGSDLIYDDIGMILGKSIRESGLLKNKQLISPKETIRATVVGAGCHIVDVSGSTITINDEELPIKNIPIIKLNKEDEKVDYQKLSARIFKKVQLFQTENDNQVVALAIQGDKGLSYIELQSLADCIIEGMKSIINNGHPLIIVVENDIAKALGQTLRAKLIQKDKVICIDSIKVENGDYIDIGKSLANGKVVPIIIKTLVFNN